MNIRNALLTALALVLPLAYAPVASAHPNMVTCRVKGVATFLERIHIQCAAPDPHDYIAIRDWGDLRYFALPTNVSSAQDAFANRVLTLANTAILTGHGVQILFDWRDLTAASYGCQVNDCRQIIEAQLTDR
jgi:hypothetical protein